MAPSKTIFSFLQRQTNIFSCWKGTATMEAMKLQPFAVRRTSNDCWIFRWNFFIWILVPTCDASQNIRCVNPGSGRACIPKSWMCDGTRYFIFENIIILCLSYEFRDCQDNSDEDANYCGKINSMSLATIIVWNVLRLDCINHHCHNHNYNNFSMDINTWSVFWYDKEKNHSRLKLILYCS